MKEEKWLLFQPQTYLFTLEKLIINILWRDALGAQLRVKVFENCFSHALKKKKHKLFVPKEAVEKQTI